jgi:hypothetical protein
MGLIERKKGHAWIFHGPVFRYGLDPITDLGFTLPIIQVLHNVTGFSINQKDTKAFSDFSALGCVLFSTRYTRDTGFSLPRLRALYFEISLTDSPPQNLE